MTLNNNNNNNNNTPPCDTGFFERLNYYFGKLMTVRDFTDEQKYFNEKRWLLNRRTIGWGVVCGLEVTKHENINNQVCVKPGLALDQYGNEIVVCQHQAVEITGLAEEKNYYICIKFKSCLAEPVPVPIEECGDYNTDCEHNRIRETFEIKAVEINTVYILTEQSFHKLECGGVSEDVLALLEQIKDQQYSSLEEFISALQEILGDQYNEYESLLLEHVEVREQTNLCDNLSHQKQKPELDCVQFLDNPCPTIIEPCEPRNQCEWLVLAKVTMKDNMVQDLVDNCSYRKLLFSNDMISLTAQCLNQQLQKVHTARIDRRQFVPLLAQTIKGLKYKDGRILSLSQVGKIQIGLHPFSITTDGDYIWFTNQEENFIKKLSRDGKCIEKIELDYPSWGIAFDGEYMWVTHITPDQNLGKISRVKVTDYTVEKIDLEGVDSDAREIVFDGQKHIWISHANNFLTKVDIHDPTKQQNFDNLTETIPEDIPITAMAYDGSALWVGYDEDNGLLKVEISNDSINVLGPIDIDKGNPKGICFDGTNIWVGHEGGASKIDIVELTEMDTAKAQRNITTVAFDGMYVWALQPGENRLNRIEIFQVEELGGVQLREANLDETFEICRICFDGIFIWATAYIELDGEKTGYIYRLLI